MQLSREESGLLLHEFSSGFKYLQYLSTYSGETVNLFNRITAPPSSPTNCALSATFSSIYTIFYHGNSHLAVMLFLLFFVVVLRVMSYQVLALCRRRHCIIQWIKLQNKVITLLQTLVQLGIGVSQALNHKSRQRNNNNNNNNSHLLHRYLSIHL